MLVLTFHIVAMLSLFFCTRLAVLQSSGEFPVSVSHVTIGTLELWMCTTMLSFIQVLGFKSCPHAYTAGAVPTERALQSHKQFSSFMASSLK